jgi:hypothetical protein
MTRHQTREVRIFALYNNATQGQHFGIVKSGTWAEVTQYINTVTPYAGARCLFLEGSDGKLRPLMA